MVHLVLALIAMAGGVAVPEMPLQRSTPDRLFRVVNAKVARKIPPQFAWRVSYEHPEYKWHLDVVVDTDGTVVEVRRPQFDNAPSALIAVVVDAVRQWQFESYGANYGNPSMKPVRFVTTIIVQLGACADGKLPGQPLPWEHKFCPTGPPSADAPAAPAAVGTPPTASRVPVPDGVRQPSLLRPMLGSDLWTLGGDQRRFAEFYAAGIARYLDPIGRRREDVPRPRHPRVDEPTCSSLIQANRAAWEKLFGALTDTLARAGGLYNEGAFKQAGSYMDDGFADAHLLMSHSPAGCGSTSIRTLYASVAMIGDGHFSAKYLRGHHTRPVAAGDLQRSATSPDAARAAARALSSNGFAVLVCDYQGVVAPAVVWHGTSPALRVVRGLDATAVALGMHAIGRYTAPSCPATYEAMQSILALSR